MTYSYVFLLKNRYSRQMAGMSLIELMVAITIALVMSLAIFSALSISEGKKRTLTSTNDVGQASTFAAYQIDKVLRSAGSGFSESSYSTFGCLLQAQLPPYGIILPYQNSMAEPFRAMNNMLAGKYRLAPIIIVKNGTFPAVSSQLAPHGSDALIVMAGMGGFGESATQLTTESVSSPTNLSVQTTLSFRAGDIALLTAQIMPPPMPAPAFPLSPMPVECMITQVASTFTGGVPTPAPPPAPPIYAGNTVPTQLPLGGPYYANPIGTANISTFINNPSPPALLFNLGSSATTNAGSNPPLFKIFGVGDNNSLMSYDLLQMGTYNFPELVADSIFEMHALYGVDSDADGKINTWVDPGIGPYDAVSLGNGSLASAENLKKIKAIRVGMIFRSALPEKATTPPVTPGPLNLFTDLGSSLTYPRDLTGTEKNFRYRTVEMTIPLRNGLLVCTKPSGCI